MKAHGRFGKGKRETERDRERERQRDRERHRENRERQRDIRAAIRETEGDGASLLSLSSIPPLSEEERKYFCVVVVVN